MLGTVLPTTTTRHGLPLSTFFLFRLVLSLLFHDPTPATVLSPGQRQQSPVLSPCRPFSGPSLHSNYMTRSSGCLQPSMAPLCRICKVPAPPPGVQGPCCSGPGCSLSSHISLTSYKIPQVPECHRTLPYCALSFPGPLHWRSPSTWSAELVCSTSSHGGLPDCEGQARGLL